MDVQRREMLAVKAPPDIVAVRQAVRAWAREQGFGIVDETKLVTAASELARNLLDHGGGGTVWIETGSPKDRSKGSRGVRLIFEDQGPGIENVEQALQDGYSTRGGLGIGLGGTRRLVSEFEIDSCVGKGTRVTVASWI